jgi:hypothetical protein
MTPEEAKKMLKAKLECLKNETSGINHDCNMRLCDGCSLNYEQGNMGEQEEALDMAIKALEQTGWIPVSEKTPEELEPVNITWVNHNPESYYANIKDKPFTATGVYFNGQWYWWSTLCTDILAEYSHNYDDIIDDDIEITAWKPLPEPYKAKSEG